MKIFIRAIRVIHGQKIQSMRRVALIAVFITVLLLVLVGGHWYLADRFVFAPALPSPWRDAALAVIAGGCLLLILQPIAERVLPPASARWIAWPAALWMGFAFLLLVLSFAADLAQSLSG